MADTNNSDVKAENSGTGGLKSNSESDWQESEWIRKIRSGLEARSGQNAGGDVPIIKLPSFLRTPVKRYTPRHWQFGLHNRDPQASTSESEVMKISLAAACKLNPGEWDKFCADVVDNPADMMLKSYGIYSSVTELSLKEVQYRLTLDALTLVLKLSSFSRVPIETLVLSLTSASRRCKCHHDERGKLPNSFIGSLVDGGFNIEALVKDKVAWWSIWDDLFLCENQIPMALLKKAISKCYGLLPGERKSNYYPDLRELENPDSNVSKKLLNTILKTVAFFMCRRFFAEPCSDEEENIFNLIDLNHEVGKLENCAHVFACIHKVMTCCVKSTTTDKKSPATDTGVFAPDVNQELETDVEATTEEESSVETMKQAALEMAMLLDFMGQTATEKKSSRTDTELSAPDESDVEAFATVGTPPIAVTTTFGGAKQLFLRAVGTSSKQLASVIATIFGFCRKPATEEGFRFIQLMHSATDLKKAGLQIRGIPGMVQQVAFKNGCLFLPIISQSESIESYICNMAAYEVWNTSGPFLFMDFLRLMLQLIKTPEDVLYLVDCDVIRPNVGTQQHIFQMWERLQMEVSYPPYSKEYTSNIVKPINRHCASAMNVMRADFYNTFCSKPWLAISVISAIILLVATLIQTYVLVIGSDKMQPHFPRGG